VPGQTTRASRWRADVGMIVGSPNSGSKTFFRATVVTHSVLASVSGLQWLQACE
jgi:hypothetical protein